MKLIYFAETRNSEIVFSNFSLVAEKEEDDVGFLLSYLRHSGAM
ncbi:hypothetical protein AB2M62_05380 [Sphingomonas sp. MMS12-HWE2-04]